MIPRHQLPGPREELIAGVCAAVALAAVVAFVAQSVRSGLLVRQPAPSATSVHSVVDLERSTPAAPDVSPYTLLWRACWLTVLLRSCVLVALGLTPIGSWIVRSVAPRGQVIPSMLVCLTVLAAVWSAGLVGRRYRQQAFRLQPQLRPLRGTRPRAVRWLSVGYVAVAGTFFLCSSPPALVAAAAVTTAASSVGLFTRQAKVTHVQPSPSFTTALKGLVFAATPWVRVTEGTLVGLGPGAGLYTVSDSPHAAVHVVVTPATHAVLTSGEVGAVLAHEVAHIQRRDITARKVRICLSWSAFVAAALGSTSVPALQILAGTPASIGPESFPLMLATGYGVRLLLNTVALRVSRGSELACDQRMLALTQDRRTCVQAIDALTRAGLSPDRLTVGQRMLVATHPGRVARLRLLADTPMPAGDLSR